uniref:Ubiquitin-activating enzyme E1 C-terminal domain-containing protein n=1 Tax=Physcomitrium patens TaxID=3218 RepID=A9TV74_PHYPA|nr:hypothetical protein PHYPA_004944 [Physcomitrium patens]
MVIFLQITMLSFEKSFLHADFLHASKIKDRMALTLLDLVITFGEVTLSPEETKICFSISCINANKEDVELPDVVAKVR